MIILGVTFESGQCIECGVLLFNDVDFGRTAGYIYVVRKMSTPLHTQILITFRGAWIFWVEFEGFHFLLHSNPL